MCLSSEYDKQYKWFDFFRDLVSMGIRRIWWVFAEEDLSNHFVDHKGVQMK